MSQSVGRVSAASRRGQNSADLLQVGAYIALLLAIAFVWNCLSTHSDTIAAARTGGAIASIPHPQPATLR